MVKMGKELINLLRDWHSVPVATVGEDGKPNVAAKSVIVRGDEKLVWGELYFMQTYQNIKFNPVASICVWSKQSPFIAYKLNGRVEIHEDEENTIQMKKHMHTSHQKKGLSMPKTHPKFRSRKEKMATVVFVVEEIYDQTPSLEAGGKKISQV
jgi:uncharacterized pyridoxamine 5'-phosphate oxidase family protein